VLRAARDRDPLLLAVQLDCGAVELGLAGCLDEVVIPAWRTVRRWRLAGRLDVRHEVLAGEAVRAWLSNRRSFGPPPATDAAILLGCGPRDRDLVVLECLAALLHERGVPHRVLGSRISTFTWTIAVQATDAAAVVMMSADSQGHRSAVESLLALHTLRIPVFYGGEAFSRGYSRRQVQGRYLGDQLRNACAMLVETLPDAVRLDAPRAVAVI
jgi:hypothetical protein